MCDEEIIEIKSYSKINKDFKVFSGKPSFTLPLIRLYYGPQECNGFIKHKPQKLHGLVACLKKHNFDVEVIPAAHLNVLKIAILGYDVYRNNIKFLQFNIDCSFDTMCQIILEKLKEATYRLYNNNNVAKNIETWFDDLQLDLSASSGFGSDDDLSTGY